MRIRPAPSESFRSGDPFFRASINLSGDPGLFGGHRRRRIYGRLDCHAARWAIGAGGYVTHRVFFAQEATAIAAGYRLCAVCMPAAYHTWNTR